MELLMVEVMGKITAIKYIRENAVMGLKQAKDLVESLPEFAMSSGGRGLGFGQGDRLYSKTQLDGEINKYNTSPINMLLLELKRERDDHSECRCSAATEMYKIVEQFALKYNVNAEPVF